MNGRHLPAAVWGGLAVVLVAAIAAGAVAVWRGADGGADLPDRVPDFSLLDSDRRPVTRDDLAGGWWAADFIFTRCSGICPLLTSRMAEIAGAIPDLRLVSFSVDPDHDTPEVLSEYAERARPDPVDRDHWRFVTGPRARLYDLIGSGFHLSVAEAAEGVTPPEGELITHSDRIVLIDPEGRIRGYYHGTENDAVERLAADLARLRAR